MATSKMAITTRRGTTDEEVPLFMVAEEGALR